jgi:hypothetical protein
MPQDVCAPEKRYPKLSPTFAGGCHPPATPGKIQCQDDEVSTLLGGQRNAILPTARPLMADFVVEVR